jgi:predicted Na+-dependent transporter
MQVVLAPVLSGIAINHFFPRSVARISPYAPTVAVFMVALTVATVMAQAAMSVRQAGWYLLMVCFSLHAGGFLLGYVASRLLGLQETVCRTNSIEVCLYLSLPPSTLGVLSLICCMCNCIEQREASKPGDHAWRRMLLLMA